MYNVQLIHSMRFDLIIQIVQWLRSMNLELDLNIYSVQSCLFVSGKVFSG